MPQKETTNVEMSLDEFLLSSDARKLWNRFEGLVGQQVFRLQVERDTTQCASSVCSLISSETSSSERIQSEAKDNQLQKNSNALCNMDMGRQPLFGVYKKSLMLESQLHQYINPSLVTSLNRRAAKATSEADLMIKMIDKLRREGRKSANDMEARRRTCELSMKLKSLLGRQKCEWQCVGRLKETLTMAREMKTMLKFICQLSSLLEQSGDALRRINEGPPPYEYCSPYDDLQKDSFSGAGIIDSSDGCQQMDRRLRQETTNQYARQSQSEVTVSISLDIIPQDTHSPSKRNSHLRDKKKYWKRDAADLSVSDSEIAALPVNRMKKTHRNSCKAFSRPLPRGLCNGFGTLDVELESHMSCRDLLEEAKRLRKQSLHAEAKARDKQSGRRRSHQKRSTPTLRDRSTSPASPCRRHRSSSRGSHSRRCRSTSPSQPRYTSASRRSRSQSLSPVQRHESLSPPQTRGETKSRDHGKRERSPSPCRPRGESLAKGQTRGRSPSRQSRGESLSKDQTRGRSRSPSLRRSRGESLAKDERGRSPSPSFRKSRGESLAKDERGRSPSPSFRRSRGESLAKDERGRSPSPSFRRSRGESLAKDERGRSPSPSFRKSRGESLAKDERGRSPSPSFRKSRGESLAKDERGRSPSPCFRKSRGESLVRDERGRSPSPSFRRSRGESLVKSQPREQTPSPPKSRKSGSKDYEQPRGRSESKSQRRSRSKSEDVSHKEESPEPSDDMSPKHRASEQRSERKESTPKSRRRSTKGHEGSCRDSSKLSKQSLKELAAECVELLKQERKKSHSPKVCSHKKVSSGKCKEKASHHHGHSCKANRGYSSHRCTKCHSHCFITCKPVSTSKASCKECTKDLSDDECYKKNHLASTHSADRGESKKKHSKSDKRQKKKKDCSHKGGKHKSTVEADKCAHKRVSSTTPVGSVNKFYMQRMSSVDSSGSREPLLFSSRETELNFQDDYLSFHYKGPVLCKPVERKSSPNVRCLQAVESPYKAVTDVCQDSQATCCSTDLAEPVDLEQCPHFLSDASVQCKITKITMCCTKECIQPCCVHTCEDQVAPELVRPTERRCLEKVYKKQSRDKRRKSKSCLAQIEDSSDDECRALSSEGSCQQSPDLSEMPLLDTSGENDETEVRKCLQPLIQAYPPPPETEDFTSPDQTDEVSQEQSSTECSSLGTHSAGDSALITSKMLPVDEASSEPSISLNQETSQKVSPPSSPERVSHQPSLIRSKNPSLEASVQTTRHSSLKRPSSVPSLVPFSDKSVPLSRQSSLERRSITFSKEPSIITPEHSYPSPKQLSLEVSTKSSTTATPKESRKSSKEESQDRSETSSRRSFQEFSRKSSKTPSPELSRKSSKTTQSPEPSRKSSKTQSPEASKKSSKTASPVLSRKSSKVISPAASRKSSKIASSNLTRKSSKEASPEPSRKPSQELSRKSSKETSVEHLPPTGQSSIDKHSSASKLSSQELPPQLSRQPSVEKPPSISRKSSLVPTPPSPASQSKGPSRKSSGHSLPQSQKSSPAHSLSASKKSTPEHSIQMSAQKSLEELQELIPSSSEEMLMPVESSSFQDTTEQLNETSSPRNTTAEPSFNDQRKSHALSVDKSETTPEPQPAYPNRSSEASEEPQISPFKRPTPEPRSRAPSLSAQPELKDKPPISPHRVSTQDAHSRSSSLKPIVELPTPLSGSGSRPSSQILGDKASSKESLPIISQRQSESGPNEANEERKSDQPEETKRESKEERKSESKQERKSVHTEERKSVPDQGRKSSSKSPPKRTSNIPSPPASASGSSQDLSLRKSESKEGRKSVPKSPPKRTSNIPSPPASTSGSSQDLSSRKSESKEGRKSVPKSPPKRTSNIPIPAPVSESSQDLSEESESFPSETHDERKSVESKSVPKTSLKRSSKSPKPSPPESMSEFSPETSKKLSESLKKRESIRISPTKSSKSSISSEPTRNSQSSLKSESQRQKLSSAFKKSTQIQSTESMRDDVSDESDELGDDTQAEEGASLQRRQTERLARSPNQTQDEDDHTSTGSLYSKWWRNLLLGLVLFLCLYYLYCYLVKPLCTSCNFPLPNIFFYLLNSIVNSVRLIHSAPAPV